MQYRYLGYLPNEGVRKGFVEARTQAEALAEVVRRGFRPLRVSPAQRLPTAEQMLPFLYGIKTGELARLARDLATMLSSGINLLRALDMLVATSHNRVLRRTVTSLRKTLEEGGSLSAALGQHPKVFSPLFVSIVEVGESTGRLSAALDQMADLLTKEHEAKQKAMRTMMYPAAVMGLSMITLAVLMTVALPSLVKIFDQMGTKIPLMTRIAISLGTGVRAHFLHILVGFIILFVAFALLQRNPRIKYRLDALKLRAPLLGTFIVKGEIARACRTIAMLLDANVPLATAIQLVNHGSKNQVLRRAFADAEQSLVSGHGLAEALKRHPVLPVLFLELVSIGEETNTLTRTMDEAASAYQKEFEQRLDALLGLMEPVTTLVIGAIVGFIAFSMFTPIYSGLKGLH